MKHPHPNNPQNKVKRDALNKEKAKAKKYYLNAEHKPPTREIIEKYKISRSTWIRLKKKEKLEAKRIETEQKSTQKFIEKKSDEKAQKLIDYQRVADLLAARSLEVVQGNKERGISPIPINKISDARQNLELAWKIDSALKNRPTEVYSLFQDIADCYTPIKKKDEG